MPLNNPIPSAVLIRWLAASVNLVTDAGRVATLAFTDVDITASTSAIAKFALLMLRVSSNIGAGGNNATLGVRKNGDAPVQFPMVACRQLSADNNYAVGFVIVALDAGQIFEYTIVIGAGVTASSSIDLIGYIE